MKPDNFPVPPVDGYRWIDAHLGFRLMQYGNCRAIIVPMRPSPWNDYKRYSVSAICHDGDKHVSTLKDAIQFAIDHAEMPLVKS